MTAQKGNVHVQGRTEITLLEAMSPLITMLMAFVVASFYIPISAEFLIVALLLAATVAGFYATKYNHGWTDIQAATGKKVAGALPAIIILLSIGMLIGTWMFSGTIPMLVYYGIKLINPQYMILTAFLATAAMSLTGSSWAAVGTIGVALMGVATAIGSPLPATAGAIVSGAFFGDKLSPLSDSTNICALAVRANLYDHIRSMLYTAIPSFILAFFVYLFASSFIDIQPTLTDTANAPILTELEQTYTFNWPLMIPPLIVIISTFKRYEAAFAMAVSSLTAMIVGVAIQDFSLNDALMAAIVGFNTTMATNNIDQYSDMSMMLLNRGGIYSMSSTLVIIIAAFILAGAMDVSGGLTKLLETLLAYVKSTFTLIVATMASGATIIGLTSHGAVTALIVGGLFQNTYKEKEIAPEVLSRSIEDSVTLLDALMPWTVTGMYMAATLGVPTLSYAPWAIFCVTGSLFSLLIAFTYKYTGFGIKKI